MVGEHQIDNAVTALAAIEILRKNSIISIKRPELDEGMKRAFQIGRFEIMGRGGRYILDGAHNRDGMESLVKTMDDVMHGEKCVVIIGILADKAVDDILDMAMYLSDTFIAVEPDNDRRLSKETLCEKIKERGAKCTIARDAADALGKAESEGCRIVCTGSLYLIGEIRRLIRDVKCTKNQGPALL